MWWVLIPAMEGPWFIISQIFLSPHPAWERDSVELWGTGLEKELEVLQNKFLKASSFEMISKFLWLEKKAES